MPCPYENFYPTDFACGKAAYFYLMNKELNQFHSRKSNRSKGYDYSLNGYYFITVCAKNMENAFGEYEGIVGTALAAVH